MSDTKQGSMSAIKLPKQYLNFVQKNPKIAQSIGTLIVNLSELTDMTKKIKTFLNTPELFIEDIEDGTEEELKGLLSAINKNLDNTVFFDNLSGEEQEELIEKISEHVGVLATKIEEKEDVKLGF